MERRAIRLEDMNHEVNHLVTPYAEVDHEKYEYTFTSGHRLVIYETFGKLPYMLAFHGINNANGELAGAATAQEMLDRFNELYLEGSIREDIMEGFVA